MQRVNSLKMRLNCWEVEIFYYSNNADQIVGLEGIPIGPLRKKVLSAPVQLIKAAKAEGLIMYEKANT